MVILDEPFVSEEVKVFLEQSQVPVLDNAFAARAGDGYRFNRVDEAAFSARMAASGETLRLLTVSENSLEWVMRHSRDTAMKDAIALMKDKAAFRRRLAPLYPDFFFREVALDAVSLCVETGDRLFQYRCAYRRFSARMACGGGCHPETGRPVAQGLSGKRRGQYRLYHRGIYRGGRICYRRLL